MDPKQQHPRDTAKVVGLIDKYNLYYTGPIDTSPVTEGVTLFKY